MFFVNKKSQNTYKIIYHAKYVITLRLSMNIQGIYRLFHANCFSSMLLSRNIQRIHRIYHANIYTLVVNERSKNTQAISRKLCFLQSICHGAFTEITEFTTHNVFLKCYDHEHSHYTPKKPGKLFSVYVFCQGTTIEYTEMCLPSMVSYKSTEKIIQNVFLQCFVKELYRICRDRQIYITIPD